MKTIDTTATVVTSTPRTYDTDARSARIKNIEIRDSQNLPPVKVSGNTFPVKSVLWALGGNWSKADNCFLMPAHTATEAQNVIDSYAASHPKQPKAPKADKPAPAKVDRPAKVAPAKVEAKPVDTAPVIKGTADVGTLCQRLANLGDLTDAVVTDLLRSGHTAAAAEAVKAMAGFNLAHKALAA
jgi:hypothetical protein